VHAASSFHTTCSTGLTTLHSLLADLHTTTQTSAKQVGMKGMNRALLFLSCQYMRPYTVVASDRGLAAHTSCSWRAEAGLCVFLGT
jgi:hypothetical protein